MKMEIENYLKQKKIEFKKFTHPAVYTCEQSEKYNEKVKGIHSKNLFIKDKKSRKFYLVVLPANKKLDIKKLEKITNNKLKFAGENDLKELLNLTPGAVSPFGLINDKTSKVNILIDELVWNSNFVSFHPNINTETLELTKEDFHKYINSLKNELQII